MTKKDTLVIIGNGFDIWQGLNTSYSEFRKYYLSHRDEILKKLWIKKKKISDDEGNSYEISDVELIYGDPFEPDDLDNEFWNTFELSLADIDIYRLNMFFGKDKNDIKKMKKSVENAGKILREAFCRWISTIKIDSSESEFKFGDNCVFINFNYTDTLQKRFCVDEDDIIYLHGEACDKESIILGHSYHPHEPEEVLRQFGPRFQGLYFVESLLYETDKHVKDNITAMEIELFLSDVNLNEIKDVYVLGHSFGKVDLEYFEYLMRATSVKDEDYEEEEDDEFDFFEDETESLDELHNRLQYAIKRYGNDESIDEPILPEEYKSVQKKLLLEQFFRDEEIKDGYFKVLSKALRIKKDILRANFEYEKDKSADFKREKDAKWHISYHTPDDKKTAETLMKLLNCKNYEFYETIDSAIIPIIAK